MFKKFVIVAKAGSGMCNVYEVSQEKLDTKLAELVSSKDTKKLRVYEVDDAFDVQQRVEFVRLPVVFAG